MLQTAVLGFPRVGAGRALKKATEAYWKGELTAQALEQAARAIRLENWRLQQKAGIDVIPSNDFSFYDQMLDMSVLAGAVPERYGWMQGRVDLPTYFAMARGTPKTPAMEMTKWFDTNYHYLVPEFRKGQRLHRVSDKPCEEFKEALAEGIATRPVLIGPVTYLALGKAQTKGWSQFELLEPLLQVYRSVLKDLAFLGAAAIQLDEPILVTDLTPTLRRALQQAYRLLAREVPEAKIMLTTYFGALNESLKLAAALPVDGLHVDLVYGAEQAARLAKALPAEMMLSLGVVDGRNIWKNDVAASLTRLRPLVKRGRRLIATSCSLLHCPLDLAAEGRLAPELKRWLAFSVQKLEELNLIKSALAHGPAAVQTQLRHNQEDRDSRARSPKIHHAVVQRRLKAVKPQDGRRQSVFQRRHVLQRQRLELPLFPTTTIGSFPQTPDIRKARADFKAGRLPKPEYEAFLRQTVKDMIRRQLALGLDVLVHGEPERNDMVEYFGEQLEGFAFTQQGWVQSYGSRYVKPPIIYGDVWRTRPMTLAWAKYAQSLTEKPVKGMLTGPITILQWSFVRNDQPRSLTAKQIALAIRDEVLDLEKAGIAAIQIDEPALREGLPLRRQARPAYLAWAVDAFRLAANGVKDDTQIHTHMCYGEFQDILKDIARMDADVISIETSRSRMELLDAFAKFRYPNEIGPGVYDIHSPRVPAVKEMVALLTKAARSLPPQHLWVNPDCGLKTRGWEETARALRAMVAAARALRKKYAGRKKRPRGVLTRA